MEFRWIEWNLDKVAKHAVSPIEAEEVVLGACRPFPQRMAERLYIVQGQTVAGRYLQVVYVLDTGDTVFVIHARGLTDPEKRRLRRRR
jgi:uncharacterized DUF497 family protein